MKSSARASARTVESKWSRAYLAALPVLLFAHASAASAAPQSSSPVPAHARQLLLVRTKSWNSVTGTLQRYERAADGSWQPAGDAAPVNVGRAGMAWGRGLHEAQTGPIKREGDGRAPAGVFAIGRAFGYSAALPPPAKNFPYLAVQKGTYCVEDTRSRYYNQIVDATDGALKGWEKRSVMLRPDGLFRWGLVVQQNDTDTKRGAGSCIFLHVWRGLGRGTAGCTAMPVEDVERLVTWIDPASEPVLVQLPEPEYSRLREPWALP